MAAVDHLCEYLAAVELEIELHAAREHGMRNARSLRTDHDATGALLRPGRGIRGGERRIPLAGGRRQRALVVRSVRYGQRDRDADERDTGECSGAQPRDPRHLVPTRSPKLSRTRLSKSSGKTPSGPANSRRYMRRNVRSSSRTASWPALSRDRRSRSQRFQLRCAPPTPIPPPPIPPTPIGTT